LPVVLLSCNRSLTRLRGSRRGARSDAYERIYVSTRLRLPDTFPRYFARRKGVVQFEFPDSRPQRGVLPPAMRSRLIRTANTLARPITAECCSRMNGRRTEFLARFFNRSTCAVLLAGVLACFVPASNVCMGAVVCNPPAGGLTTLSAFTVRDKNNTGNAAQPPLTRCQIRSSSSFAGTPQ
jgi:hypothetical protein